MASKWVCLSTAELRLLTQALSYCLQTDPARQQHTADESKLKSLLRKIDRLTRTTKVQSRKGKGRELQKWAAQRVAELTGLPFDQSDDESLIRYREGGQPGTDVILRGAAAQRFPFAVECKSVEALNLRTAIEQARSNASEQQRWLVVHRSRRLPETVVIMGWDAFESLNKQSSFPL